VIYLLAVSLIWSFSFSLFKSRLTGLDPNLMTFLRMSLALPLVLPLLRLGGVRLRQRAILLGIGAVQYGLMYAALHASYQYLQGWQVALMTVFTPLYISLFDSLMQRRLDLFHLAMAGLAVLGAALIQARGPAFDGALAGILLVQAANICFSLGQLAYRSVRKDLGEVRDIHVYGLPCLGGFVVSALATTLTGGWGQVSALDGSQWAVLAYLGTVSSGLCFFLWNVGATQVNVGTLAVMNNIKIPLAVLVGLVVFNEPADIKRLALGGGIILAAVAATEFRKLRAALGK